MDYHTKYIKYKNKYLELKGGFINKPQFEDNDLLDSLADTNKKTNTSIYNTDTDLFYDEPKITKIEFLKILDEILAIEDTKLSTLKSNITEIEKNKKKIKVIGQNIEILKKISEKSKLESDEHLFSYLQKENIPGGQKIDATVIQQFNEQFNQYLISLSDKYNEVFSSIVPFNNDFFPILRHKNTYSIYLENTYSGPTIMYEIYSKNDKFKQDNEKFLLDDNFKFNKISSIFEELKSDEKYPLINNANFLQAYILTANKSTLESLLIFYAKYFKDDFTNWFKSYGFIDTKTEQIIYYYKPNIMCSFIFAHQIKKFYDSYLEIDNYPGSYENFLLDLPELTLEEKEDVKKAIDSTIKYKSEVDKILIILRKIIIQKDHPKHNDNIAILKYCKYLLQTELNKDFLNFFINTVGICDMVEGIGITEQLFSAYNFLRINNKYNETMKQIDKDTDFYKSIKELNVLIKLSFEQNKNLFFIDLVEELYYYKVLKNKAKDSSFLESILLFLFINYLDNHPILSKVQNTKLHFENFASHTLSSSTIINKSGNNFRKSANHLNNLLMDFYRILFFSKEYLIGLKFCNYGVMTDNFEDPRGLTGVGLLMERPMCGEVTILNFINTLIWNAKEKKLDPEYLPETSIDTLKKFYNDNQHNLLKLETKKIYTEFFKLLRDIPFTLSAGELKEKSTRNIIRDYGDNNLNSPYRYYTEDANHNIIKGNELRVTYKNMCRVLAHLFNKNDLFKSISNDILDENTLKDIIMMFRNPIKDNLIKDYKFEGDYVFGIIKFDSFRFTFGYHSEETINTASDTSLEQIMNNYLIEKNIFQKNNFSNIPEAIFSAKIKGNKYEHKEFNFKLIDDESLITYLNVLATVENYYIDKLLINNLLAFKKTNVVIYLFKELIVYNTSMWIRFLSYILGIDDQEYMFFINKYLNIVKRNKFKIKESENLLKWIPLYKNNGFSNSSKIVEKLESIKELLQLNITENRNCIILLIEKQYDKLLELIKENTITFINIFSTGFGSKLILNEEFINKIIIFFRDDSNKKYLFAGVFEIKILIVIFLFRIKIEDKHLINNFSKLFGFLVKKSIDFYPMEFKNDFFNIYLENFLESGTSIENEELKFFTYKKFNIIFEKITIDEKLIVSLKSRFKTYIKNHKLNISTLTSDPFKNFTQFNKFITFNNNIPIRDLF